LNKIRAGEPLDPADVQYATAVFREAEAKWMRQTEIAQRALRANTRAEQEPLTVLAEGETIGVTADDWLTKFWDDGGLVSDEMLQEMYARVLAREAINPGFCSMRTLRVMRYMDRQTAEDFAKIAALVVDGSWIPAEESLLDPFGVNLTLVLEADDAGLIDSGQSIGWRCKEDDVVLTCHDRLLRLTKCKGLNIPVFPLRRAGEDLAKIAQVAPDPDYFAKLFSWIRARARIGKLAWALRPTGKWNAASLTWTATSPEQ
jgi:hypothetical protein